MLSDTKLNLHKWPRRGKMNRQEHVLFPIEEYHQSLAELRKENFYD